ncbi:MAG: diguanylate cyclase (GGDEF)-like protein/PAS domain S-box-containing protein [Pseudohongiellaceae bacterium]
MEKIFIIDSGHGVCIEASKSWRLSNTTIHQESSYPQLLTLIADKALALVVYNLDSEKHQLKGLIAIVSANRQESDKPILVVSKDQTKLDSLLDHDTPGIEFCNSSKGLDYVEYRVNHLLKLQRFTRHQSRILIELENRNKVLLESASEGIIQYDGTGEICYANPKALKLLRYSLDSIKKVNVFDLLTTNNLDAGKSDNALTELTRNMLQNKAFVCNRVLIQNSQNISIVTEISCNSILDADGLVANHIMMFQDITARTLNEQRLIKLAKYDVLTGLSNRSKFHDFTEGKIAYCAHNRKKLALLFIDIDHFKNINDSMGHDAGDELLVSIAERLSSSIRETDLVARIGGDEFAITLLEMGNPNQVTKIVQHILEVLSKPFFVQSREINVSASIGISLYPESGSDIKTLTKTADTAVHQAKADGRNTYRFFSNEIQNRVIEQHSLELALKKALMNDEFFIHYQPLIDALSGRIVGLEALVRWQHEDWPNMGPHRFIPVAEECGLLPALGKWVLLNACRQSVKWLKDSAIRFDYPVSVNLSPKQLNHSDFVEVLIDVLQETQIPPKNLVLELTETAVMQNPELAISILGKINSAGVKLAVDDFGTGYSSLNYLKQLPISKLKIDRSFVNDIGVDQNGEAIVKAILALAHSLNLEVVAEGVEEQFQVDFLRGHDCEVLQGYFFSQPMAADAISELLRQEKIKWAIPYPKIASKQTKHPGKPDIPFH